MRVFESNSIAKFKEEMSENLNEQKGKIVKRYNISLGKLEYYFIPTEYLEEYERAHFDQDPDAPARFGMLIKRAGF